MSFRQLTPLPHCLICREDKPLRKSHVVPDFFKKWLLAKVGGPPRFFNYHASLTRYAQDLTKHRLCCQACEQLLSIDEGVTRQKMLAQWQEGDAPWYGPWLARFAAGLALKAGAVTCYADPTFKDAVADRLPANEAPDALLPPDKKELVLLAMERWRAFLLREAPHPSAYEFHLYEADPATYPGVVGTFGHYPVRTTKGFLALVLLLNGIVIVAVVAQPERLDRATRIAIGGGLLGVANRRLPWEIANALQWFSDVSCRSRQLQRQELGGK